MAAYTWQVRSHVQAGGGSNEILGDLTIDYTIQPSAEMTVQWKFEWSGADKDLWEIGLCLPVAAGDDRQSWSRDSYFTAYPKGHIGAPSGACGPSEVAFRSSKRSLHFLTLTNASGAGIALIAAHDPLIGRARSDARRGHPLRQPRGCGGRAGRS